MDKITIERETLSRTGITLRAVANPQAPFRSARACDFQHGWMLLYQSSAPVKGGRPARTGS